MHAYIQRRKVKVCSQTHKREKKNIHTQTQKILRKREKTGRRQGKFNKTCRHNINKCKFRHTVSKKDTTNDKHKYNQRKNAKNKHQKSSQQKNKTKQNTTYKNDTHGKKKNYQQKQNSDTQPQPQNNHPLDKHTQTTRNKTKNNLNKQTLLKNN